MKVNTTGNIREGKLSDTQIDQLSRNTGKQLGQMKKREVILPRLEGHEKQGVVECSLNGFTYMIPRGKRVALAEPIISILRNAGVL